MARSPRALSKNTSTNNDLVASFGSHRHRLDRVRCNNRSTACDTQLPPFHHRRRRALPQGARLVCSVRTLSHGLYAYTFEKLSHSAWWQPWRRSLCSKTDSAKKVGTGEDTGRCRRKTSSGSSALFGACISAGMHSRMGAVRERGWRPRRGPRTPPAREGFVAVAGQLLPGAHGRAGPSFVRF